MQRNLNGIKTLFDDILVKPHLIQQVNLFTKTSQGKMDRTRTERMLRYLYPPLSGDSSPRQSGSIALNANCHGSKP
jgi:hypothetical protein